MATFKWIISALDCVPSLDGRTNVVRTVHWRCTGHGTVADREYIGTVYSTCTLPDPAGSGDFVAYADLTQEQVLAWIWDNGVDHVATEALVQQQLDLQINPPVVQPPLPWNSTAD